MNIEHFELRRYCAPPPPGYLGFGNKRFPVGFICSLPLAQLLY